LIQRAVGFAKRDLHFENAKELFKTIKEIPQLREYGGESLSNKQLSQYISQNDNTGSQRLGGDDLL
jgi:hypothetical protein